MKVFVVCALFGLASASAGLHHPKWAAYKAAHGKDYHPSEEAQRALNFAKTNDYIEEHNARYARGEVEYSLGHNKLSDMTPEEVRAKYLGRIPMSVKDRNITELPNLNLPANTDGKDWRKDGFITTPKDQQLCGSCYAFATVGGVEHAILQSRVGPALDLSEQQIVDCSFGSGLNNGCKGGHEVNVMDYIKANGVTTESAYPYTSGRSKMHGTCRSRAGTYGKGLKYRSVPANNESGLRNAVANWGPLVVPISGENRDLQLLRDGIYTNRNCPKTIDHVVTIVGFGTEGGVTYWIVKNSWGTTWGVNGFGKLLYGCNMCGLNSDSSYHIYF